jgi:hypothetical protein
MIDLGAILIAETRQAEVATVTPTKAPELLSAFNTSWRDIHQLVTKLTAEKIQAEKHVANRRARLLLEVVPAKLKELGVPSSADMREAVVQLDPERESLQDRVDQLDAAIEYLKGKLKSFENSFTSVKKIMGEDSYSYAGKNTNLSGDTSAPIHARPASVPPSSGRILPGFGRPKV